MSDTQFANHLALAAEIGARRAIEAYGNVPITITYNEVMKMYGKSITEEARMALKVNWVPIKTGRRKSDCYCLRSEFDKWIVSRVESFYK